MTGTRRVMDGHGTRNAWVFTAFVLSGSLLEPTLFLSLSLYIYCYNITYYIYIFIVVAFFSLQAGSRREFHRRSPCLRPPWPRLIYVAWRAASGAGVGVRRLRGP